MSRIILAEQSATPATPSSGKVAIFSDTTANPRIKTVDDAGVVSVVGPSPTNASTVAVAAGYATDTYLAGSSIIIPAGHWKVGTTYKCVFDMTKTAAGTAQFTVIIRMGTLGTTGDAAICTFAYAVGTAAIDSGIFTVVANFRTVGAGTAAVLQGRIMCNHHLAATGLITTGASGTGVLYVTSSGFASTTQTHIGLSVNGGASFSGTNTQVTTGLFGI